MDIHVASIQSVKAAAWAGQSIKPVMQYSTAVQQYSTALFPGPRYQYTPQAAGGRMRASHLYSTSVLHSKQSGLEAIPGRIRPRCQHLHRGRPARAFPFQLSNRTEIGMKLAGSRQLLQRQVPTPMMNVMRCFSQSLMAGGRPVPPD